MMKKHTLYIIDDHKLFMESFQAYILSDQTFHICGMSTTSKEALYEIKKKLPNVVLIDYHLRNENGLDLLKNIKLFNKTIKCIILSMNRDLFTIEYAIDCGADGFLTKDMDGHKIINSILEIIENNKIISPIESNTYNQINAYNLTKRELEIAKLVCKGHTSNEISSMFFLSTHTINTHRKNILNKLSAKNTLNMCNIIKSLYP